MSLTWLGIVSDSKQVSGGQTGDADFLNYQSALTGTYSSNELNAIEQFYLDLKAGGIYDYDRIYLMCTDVESDTLIDMVSATSLATNNGMTFTARRGLQGNGSTAYFATGYTPSTDAINFTQNSASLSIYSRDNTSIDGYDIGAQNSVSGGNGRIFIASRWDDGNQYSMINGSGSNFSASPSSDSSGLQSISRTSSTLQTVYKTDTAIDTETSASTAVTNREIWVGALNAGGTRSGETDREYSIVLIGPGRTGAEMTTLNNAVNALITAFGANI